MIVLMISQKNWNSLNSGLGSHGLESTQIILGRPSPHRFVLCFFYTLRPSRHRLPMEATFLQGGPQKSVFLLANDSFFDCDAVSLSWCMRHSARRSPAMGHKQSKAPLNCSFPSRISEIYRASQSAFSWWGVERFRILRKWGEQVTLSESRTKMTIGLWKTEGKLHWKSNLLGPRFSF